MFCTTSSGRKWADDLFNSLIFCDPFKTARRLCQFYFGWSVRTLNKGFWSFILNLQILIRNEMCSTLFCQDFSLFFNEISNNLFNLFSNIYIPFTLHLYIHLQSNLTRFVKTFLHRKKLMFPKCVLNVHLNTAKTWNQVVWVKMKVWRFGWPSPKIMMMSCPYRRVFTGAMTIYPIDIVSGWSNRTEWSYWPGEQASWWEVIAVCSLRNITFTCEIV